MVTERGTGIPGGRAPEFPVTTEKKNPWWKKDVWTVRACLWWQSENTQGYYPCLREFLRTQNLYHSTMPTYVCIYLVYMSHTCPCMILTGLGHLGNI